MAMVAAWRRYLAPHGIWQGISPPAFREATHDGGRVPSRGCGMRAGYCERSKGHKRDAYATFWTRRPWGGRPVRQPQGSIGAASLPSAPADTPAMRSETSLPRAFPSATWERDFFRWGFCISGHFGSHPPRLATARRLGNRRSEDAPFGRLRAGLARRSYLAPRGRCRGSRRPPSGRPRTMADGFVPRLRNEGGLLRPVKGTQAGRLCYFLGPGAARFARLGIADLGFRFGHWRRILEPTPKSYIRRRPRRRLPVCHSPR